MDQVYMKDPYQILDVPRRATADEIKQSYRRMARLRHPDLFPDNPKAEEQFKDIAQAYQLLSDKTQRARFDRGDIDMHGNKLKTARTKKRKSPFDRFHKEKNKSRNAQSNAIKIDGADVEYSLSISFAEASQGVNKHISMTNGKRLKITVPPGTQDQQTLRLKGQGMSGIGGGKSGDALIDIEVRPDPMFQTEGNDVHIDFPVTLPEAVLGAKVEVPTLGGLVTLSIPKGSNTGTILRLKDKGIQTSDKNGNNRQTGDQYVTLRIVLPSKPDKQFIDFVEKWHDEKPYTIPGRNKNAS